MNDRIRSVGLNVFQYSKWLNSSIRFIDGPLTSIMTPGQRGPGSNEVVLHIPPKVPVWSLIIRWSLVSYPKHSLVGDLSSLQWCSWRILEPQPIRFDCFWEGGGQKFNFIFNQICAVFSVHSTGWTSFMNSKHNWG